MALKYTRCVNFLLSNCLAIIILDCVVFGYLHRSFHEMNLAVSQAPTSFSFCWKKRKEEEGGERVWGRRKEGERRKSSRIPQSAFLGYLALTLLSSIAWVNQSQVV